MKHVTRHCDLCGSTLQATRMNGWQGALMLKKDGNFFFPDEMENMEVCKNCGDQIVRFIKDLKRTVRLSTEIEITKESAE